MNRDLLSWVHDGAEAAVMVGILVAIVIYVVRDRRSPVDLFGDVMGAGLAGKAVV